MATGPGHAALRRTEEGCLALADISGYTTYLSSVELDHSQDVLEDLTETVVRGLTPPMRLANLEGDAAFVYAPGRRIDASMLLDTVDSSYFAFRRRQDAIDRATECDCNACQLIPRLDLKFVAHHGRFGRQHLAGREELSGPDVVVVHRLLKNRVAEELGHTGYAFFTDAIVAAMAADPEALRMRRHAEEIDGVGRVDGWVEDLHERWTEERERRRVRVGAEESRWTSSFEVPAPRAMAWNYLTDPALRRRWQPTFDRIDEESPAGRRGRGTMNHCMHGSNVVLEEILDWRPFDYFTIEVRPPMPLVQPMRLTWDLEETPEGGTRMTQSMAPSPGFAQGLLFSVMQRMMQADQVQQQRLLEAVLTEAATGGAASAGSDA